MSAMGQNRTYAVHQGCPLTAISGHLNVSDQCPPYRKEDIGGRQTRKKSELGHLMKSRRLIPSPEVRKRHANGLRSCR